LSPTSLIFSAELALEQKKWDTGDSVPLSDGLDFVVHGFD